MSAGAVVSVVANIAIALGWYHVGRWHENLRVFRELLKMQREFVADLSSELASGVLVFDEDPRLARHHVFQDVWGIVGDKFRTYVLPFSRAAMGARED